MSAVLGAIVVFITIVAIVLIIEGIARLVEIFTK